MTTTGQIFPTASANVAEAPWSDNIWSTPENAYADDGSTANVIAPTFDSGDQTYVLKLYTFNFSSIPDGATIDGVTCRVNVWYRSGQGSGSLDLLQLLDTSLAKVGTNQCSTPVALTTDDTTIITKGSTSDLWGNALDAAWVKNANFGVAIGILATAANADVDVDYVTLEIEYTAPTSSPIAGSTAGTAVAEGILSGIGALAGTATAVGTPTASIAGFGALAGISEGFSVVSGTLTADHIEIQRRENGGAWAWLEDVSPTDTEYTDTSTFTAGVLYEYQIRLWTSGVPGEWSNIDGVTYVEVAGAIEGASAGTSSAAAALDGIGSLAGSSDGSAAAAASLTAQGSLLGETAGTSAVTAQLSASGDLVGSSSGVAAVAGSLAASGDLAGTTDGTSTTAGTLSGIGTLAGAAAGTATVSGMLDLPAGMIVGVAAGQAVASATLSGTGILFGSAAGQAGVTAIIDATGSLAGSSAGVASASGTLHILASGMEGTAAGAATAVGTLIGIGALGGTAAGLATLAVILTATGALSGSAAGMATVIGSTKPPVYPAVITFTSYINQLFNADAYIARQLEQDAYIVQVVDHEVML